VPPPDPPDRFNRFRFGILFERYADGGCERQVGKLDDLRAGHCKSWKHGGESSGIRYIYAQRSPDDKPKHFKQCKPCPIPSWTAPVRRLSCLI
jgi:hypothetical protein